MEEMEEVQVSKIVRKSPKLPPKPLSKPKGIGLQQLKEKKFVEIEGLSQEFKDTWGDIDGSFDVIFFGDSSNGKTTAVAGFIDQLLGLFKCRCNYISYEEGHGKTMQRLLVDHYKLLEKHGNCLTLFESFTFEQLNYYMAQQRSAKIWVFDSIQASGLTFEQFEILRNRYVLGKASKIFIYISWAEGKLPQGATAKSVRYMAQIKVRVEGFIQFIRSRFGTKKNCTTWEEGAKSYWGKAFKKMMTKK